jgi:MFS family permease
VYLLVGTVGGVLGLRFLDRVGKGLRDAPRDAIISLSSPQEELGRSFGYHRAMDTTGAILGPLCAYLLLRAFPLRFNVVFISAFAVGLLAIASLFLIRDVVVPTAARMKLRDAWAALSSAYKHYLCSLFFLSVGTVPVAVILLKTVSLGLLIADIPLFYMLYSVSYALFSFSAGTWSDRVGQKKILTLGYFILLVSYACIAVSTSAATLALSFFILGLVPALTDGVQRSYAAHLSGEALRGGALGLLNATVGFGALAAGIGGGFLWQTFGPTTALSAAAAVVVLGLVLLLPGATAHPTHAR